MKKITVALTNKHYDVLIEKGLLSNAGKLISAVWTPRKVAIVSDDNVAPLYQQQLADQLTNNGFTVHCYQFPAGEASKSLSQLQTLAQQLVTDNFNRDDGVVALGGGVTGDLAGFLAATYMRGISLIQVPTSLLAQVDSSVGGKTAVDLGTTKNIVGSFYEPDLVLIDPTTLKTLTQRDLVEGYGEIVKVAAMTGGNFWQLIEKIESPTDILANATSLSEGSIQFKADIVMAAEKEGGQRQLLNFGHTIGPAVEAFEEAGKTAAGVTAKIRTQLAAVGLPVSSPLLSSPQILDKIKHDKKNHNGHLNLVYIKKIGQPVILTVPENQISNTLKVPRQ